MTYEVDAGVVALNTSTGNQSVASLSFTPKVILFFPTDATADGVQVDAFHCIGIGISSTERAALNVSLEDAQGTSDSQRETNTSLCFFKNNAGSSSAEYEADLVSLNSDGFTFNLTTAPGSAKRVFWLALGGDDLTNVALTTFTTATSTGNQSVSSLSFQPDAVLFFNLENSAASQSQNDGHISFGMAVSSTKRALISAGGDQGLATTDTFRHQRTNACIMLNDDDGTVLGLADFVSQDTNGFTVNWSAAHTGGRIVHFLALKGGQYDVGSLTTQTSTGNFSETGVGFQGMAGIFASFCNAASGGKIDHSEMSLGVAVSSSARFQIGGTGEDAQGTSDSDGFQDDGLIYQNYDYTQTLEGSIDFVSWGSNGFTLNQVDADPTSGNEIIYFIIGADAGGTEFQQAIVGTLTTSGVIINQGQKVMLGTQTTAGNLTNQMQTALIGTLTTAGAVLNNAQKVIAGTLTTAGELTKQAQIKFVGTLTTAGALFNQAQILIAGVLSTAGGLVLQAQKALIGTLTTAGVVSGVKKILLSVAGTLATAGALTNKAQSVLSAVLTTAGAIALQAQKAIAATLTTAGVVTGIRLFILSIAGTLTTAGALVNQMQTALTATLTTAGIVITQTKVSLISTLTTSGIVSGLRTSFVAIVGTLTSSGVLAKQVGTFLIASTTTAGTVVNQAQIALVGTITSAGALISQAGIVMTGAVTTAGALIIQSQILIVGTLSSVGAIAKQAQALLVGTLSISGIVTTVGAVQKSLVATLTTVGIVSTTVTYLARYFRIVGEKVDRAVGKKKDRVQGENEDRLK